ncbi:MAG: hypothetical protein ACXWDO_10205 [Bacteroidia bacterium]
MQSVLKIFKNNFAEISVAFAFWALLIIRFGYAFGTGDQAEFLPYALKIADNSLYPTDLFIQKLAENPINERIFFCSFLSIFTEYVEIVCFLGHLFFTVLLVVGLLKICRQFISNPVFSYAVIFALLVLSAGKLPGGATMYSSSFLPDIVSHSLGAWGIYFVLKNRLIQASVLLIIATLMHPLIGLFVALLAFGGYVFHIVLNLKMLPDRKCFIAVFIYILTAGVYLFLLVPDEAKTLTNEAYYRIFFELRYPHHTLPSHFSKIGLAGLIIFAFAGLFYFYQQQKAIFWFLLLQCFGFCVYYIGLEHFNIVEIGLTQWFRSSMWTYFFGLIAFAAITEKQLNLQWKPGNIFYSLAIIFTSITLIILLVKPQIFPLDNTYEIGRHKYKNDEIVVSEKIREMNLTGTYMLPFNFNAHKYYSRQSSYADYKTIPRKNANLGEWYRRMNLVYNLDTAKHLHGFEAEANADSFYRELPSKNLAILKAEGIDYLLSDTIMQREELDEVLKYKNYYVYKLK